MMMTIMKKMLNKIKQGVKITAARKPELRKDTGFNSTLHFLSVCRFPEGQTGQLRRGVLPGRHPPDHWRDLAVSDTLGGSQEQEEKKGRGTEQGEGPQREDDGP